MKIFTLKNIRLYGSIVILQDFKFCNQTLYRYELTYPDKTNFVRTCLCRNACKHKCPNNFYLLFCPQAIGDNGQGFLNFVFFCVLQARVRQYTRDKICRCLSNKKHHMYSDKNCNKDINDDSFTASGTPSQMSNYSSDPPRDWIEDLFCLINICIFVM